MNIEIILSFMAASAVLALSPGPDNIFVLTQSIVHGKKFGLATVAGLMSGCIIHTSLVAFGVSAALQQSPTIFFAIKLFGATYLVYLAYLVFKSPSDIMISTSHVPKKSMLALFRTGFLMNVLNPKVTIFFLAFFPQFLFSEELSTVLQFYILGLLFVLVSCTIFSSIALLGGRLSNYLNAHHAVGLYLKWLQILVFLAIAVFILV